MAGRLAALPGERATRSDWANHISTIFPEVRLKRYLEMRGADVGPPEMIAAQAAFWTGLLYDRVALDGAGELVRDWSAADRQSLRDAVPRLGLRATVGARTVRDVARDALALSRQGLVRRARQDQNGRDETCYLAPLDAIVSDGFTQADHLLEDYGTSWSRSIEPAFSRCVF